VLRVDLLPKVIVQGRRNVTVTMFCLIGIVVTAIVMFLMLQQVKNNIAQTEEKLADAKQRADAVRKIKNEAKAKDAELAPIQAKIDFVDAADASGEQFFDRFWKINEYIYSRAQMSSFEISPPASVKFTIQIADTTEAGRFLLNLIRCPHITGIQISGMPAGDTVEPTGSTVMRTIGSTVMRTMEEVITFNVSATLTEGVEIPEPPGGEGAAGAPGAGGPEDMMMEGMPPPPEPMGAEPPPPPA